MKKYVALGFVAVAAALVGYHWWTGRGGAAQMPGGEPEVSVVTMKTEQVVLTKDLPGRTSAVRVAEIRPQVNGIVEKRLFAEGGMVEEGQQLYQIAPAPYEAAYASSRADLQKAEANVKSAEARAVRYEELVKIGGVSQQEYDDAKAAMAQAKADVAIAKAAVATAKINLDYTKVMSPISGRIGQSSVTEGALVTANQPNALATVQQLDRIYVDVSQSSEEIMRLRRQYAAQSAQGGDAVSPTVQLVVDGAVVGEAGELQFSDASVNPTTGTVLLRALFPNPNHEILPGMFVHARLEQWRDDSALLVPQQSVSRQADGSVSVWVVETDGKVNPRPISVTEVVGDRWLVSGGLKPGDKVVVEGTMKIQPGITVKAAERTGEAKAPAPAAAAAK